MAIRIAVGDESFEDIRKAGLYYVDKTELIYELAGQADNKVTIFTRPRRFGKTLMRMMQAVYGKPVILLIDEYDVPLSKASEKNTARNRYYEQMLDMIKGLLSVALKTNEYLKFAVITGCLRITKESIFTGTNNFASYSVLVKDRRNRRALLIEAKKSNSAAQMEKRLHRRIEADRRPGLCLEY